MNDKKAGKRVLVVYYSLTGNTARVARDLAMRLNADVESVQDQGHGTGFLGQFAAAFDAWRKAPTRIGIVQRDPTGYDITIMGTPVWTWQMTPAIRAYLRATQGKIQNVAFFITSGNTDIEKIAPSLEALAGRKAVASAGFNARELADAVTYQRKLAAFVDAVRCTSASA